MAKRALGRSRRRAGGAPSGGPLDETAVRTDRRRRVAALLTGTAALVATAIVPGVAAAAPPDDAHCATQDGTTTCRYTSADTNVDFTAPPGVDAFSVTASGASGGPGADDNDRGSRPGGAAGVGTTLTGEVTVGVDRTFHLLVGSEGRYGSPFDSIYVSGGIGAGRGGAGGAGAYGNGGGGGGGGTSITQDNGVVVLVAGGGAGGGGAGRLAPGGAGRPADPTATTTTEDGGDGGAGRFGYPREGAGGGGGGGGLRGGTGGAAGSNSALDPVGADGGTAGTSSPFGTASDGPLGDGSITITFRTPITPPTTTPPTTSNTCPVTSTPSRRPATTADLCTTVASPASLALGQNATITMTVTNRGGLTATDVRSTLTIPGGLRPVPTGAPTTFRSAALAPGQSRTYTVAVTASRAVRNVVEVNATSRTPDAGTRDNFARTTTTVR